MKTDRYELVDVHIDNLLRESEKAFLVEVDGEESWVAKSQVDNTEELEEELGLRPQDRAVDTITVPKWLAVENGWLDE